MAKKEKRKLFYLIYIGLIIASILLLTTSLALRFTGYFDLDAMFVIVKISLILLVVSIFFKSKI